MEFSLPTFLLGLALAALQTVPVAWAAWRLATVLVPGRRPMLRTAVAFLTGFLEVILVLQILGLASLLSRWPVVAAALAVAALTWGLARLLDGRVTLAHAGLEASALGLTAPDAGHEVAATTVGSTETVAPEDDAARSGPDWIRILTLALLVGAGTTVWLTSLLQQSFGTDTASYHLPDIAQFVRTHTILEVPQYQLGVYQGAYPMNAELTSAWFVFPFGRDFLVNLASFFQFLFVGAAVGALAEHFRVRTWDAVLIATAAVFMPAVATTHIGSVANDLLPMAGVVVALLFVDRWRRTEAPADLVVGALALGLAFGAKFTMVLYVAPIGATFLVLALWRRRFVQALVALPVAFLVPSAVWFARNLVVKANPIWGFELGPFEGGFIRDDVDSDSVLDYLFNAGPKALSTFLGEGFGLDLYLIMPLGVTVLVLLGLPAIWRTLRGDRARLWIFAGIPLLAFPFLWAQAWTGGFDGYNIPATVRYVSSSYAVLLVVATARHLLGARSQRWRVGLLVVAAMGAAVSLLAPTLPLLRAAPAAIAVGGLAGLVMLAAAASRRRSVVAAVLVGLGVMALVAPVALSQRWQDSWYRDVYEDDLAMLNTHVQDEGISRSRILVAGIPRSYPLANVDLSNDVGYLGDGSRSDPWGEGDSERWIEAVRADCARYVAVSAAEEQIVSEDGRVVIERGEWLHRVPEARFVDELGEDDVRPLLVRRDDKDGTITVGLYEVQGLAASC